MSKLGDAIERSLPAGLTLPDELKACFDWMEVHGCCTVEPHQVFLEPTPETGQLGAVFTDEGNADLALDLGVDDDLEDALEDRLYRFCRIGGDGTHAAFWLDDDGRQHIVQIAGFDQSGHLCGSALDFLRMIAAGHHEVAHPWDLDDEDPECCDAAAPLREWLLATHGVTPPDKLSDIAPRRGDDDPFREWLGSLE